jgi:hypothetical protein
VSAELEPLGRRLVGAWTTEATHPAFPGTVVSGTAQVEWLEGERFLIFRTHNDHPDFPDSVSIIGDTAGLEFHYFDSRGVHRVYAFRVDDDGWTIARDVPADDESGFSQVLTVTFEGGDTMEGRSKVSHDNQTWQDDLQITYRRSQ